MIDEEEAWDLNTRRHGRGRHKFIAEIIDEWGKERRNINYGIFYNSSKKGLDTHYGKAFKST